MVGDPNVAHDRGRVGRRSSARAHPLRFFLLLGTSEHSIGQSCRLEGDARAPELRSRSLSWCEARGRTLSRTPHRSIAKRPCRILSRRTSEPGSLAAPVARREAEHLPHLLHAVSGLSATQKTSRDPTPRGDARERARADGSEDREPVPREALRLRRSPGPARFENKLPALAARAGRRRDDDEQRTFEVPRRASRSSSMLPRGQERRRPDPATPRFDSRSIAKTCRPRGLADAARLDLHRSRCHDRPREAAVRAR